ncbi:MAG: hypothetical protein KJ613_03610, partial [Nanoarchaeota archaeon]|nr:hypothetical protein [Nanoarchaeota archaeon]
MQKKLSILFVLVLLVSVSGCTTLESGNGVVIKEFTTDFNEVISGERADFYLKIKNIGSQTAENVFAEIYGLDFGWKEIESGMKCPNEKPISLIAPNTLYGTEGEEKVCIWSYTASDVPAGMSTTYEPKARVFYDYQTDAVIGLTLVSREEMIRLQNSGKAPQIDVLSKTSSPIDVAVNLQTPIRVSGNEASFILGITVTNVGEGVPCLKGRCKSSAGYPIEDPKTD